MNLSWQAVVEKTVTGLGYDLVGCERSAAGLLRVYIDKPLQDGREPEQPVNVEDCERVTRQLQYVLEVENCDYQRLEVSTPGLDRPLNKADDYLRFCGYEVEVTLREAFQGRKKYRGVLSAQEASEPPADAQASLPAQGWRLVFQDGKAEQALDFTLDEVRSAKLVPQIDFKGRNAADKKSKDLAAKASKAKSPRKKSNAKSRQQSDEESVAANQDDKVDGGLEQ